MSVSKDELQSRLDFAVDAAKQASDFILKYYQNDDLAIELKGDMTPVTAADRGAEDLLRWLIGQKFPQDGILGEEFGVKESQNGFRWILDPVDGTKSFVHGVPLFGTLIGLQYQGEVVVGVCRFPALDEVVYAAKGLGAWWQKGTAEARAAHVSTTAKLADSLFCITTVTGWSKIGRADAFEKLSQATRLTRGWGDCYGHILVATGRADVMVDPQMAPWDVAALIPIVQEAGGHFVTWDGKVTVDGGNGLSVNAHLKDAVLELLK